MKLIDKNGKIFGKINLVDLGIVLLLVLAVAAVGFKIMKERLIERETAVIQYTLYVEGVRQQSVDAINMVYDDITDAENDDPLGKIIDVRQEPAAKIVQKADGEYTKAYYPDKFDLYVTLETKGVVSKDGYFADSGKKILYGDTIGINNGYSQMFGVVEDIKIVAGEKDKSE